MRPRALALAVTVSTALVLSAPFVGQARGLIRAAFPGQFVLVVGGLVAAGAIAVVMAALRRIQSRRVLRLGGVGLAFATAALYAFATAGDNAESNVVELFHFLQYGLITFLFYRAWRPLADAAILLLPLLAALIVGMAEEGLQWFIPNRVGELRDVLLNLVAITTGLLFSVAVLPPDGWRGGLSPRSRGSAGWLSAAAIVALAGFLHAVHLGHVIEDAGIGRFDSRWTAEELLRQQDDRARAWAASPPRRTVVRLSREDQYLTEGIQHVRWRNRLWSAGDIDGAWRENRILEQYYAPVLDTPTHEGGGHRWPGEQRADAERRRVSPDGTYASGAYPYTVYTWSPTDPLDDRGGARACRPRAWPRVAHCPKRGLTMLLKIEPKV